MRLSLEFSLPARESVDLRGILPESLLALSRRQISRLPVRLSGRQVALGEICRVGVAAHGNDALHLLGDTALLEHVGWQMTCGLLVVEGDAGYGAGQGMCGGTLEVHGSAGDCLGLALQGGLIRVSGSVGDGCGAELPGASRGMGGGVILVAGNAGRELGSTMRRGFIYVAGNTAEYCATRMLAGTIFCAGRVGRYAGAGMRRGSLVAGTMEGMLPGFKEAGRADPGWLGICLVELANLGVPLSTGWAGVNLQRWSGDHLESGKGEILVHDEPQ